MRNGTKAELSPTSCYACWISIDDCRFLSSGDRLGINTERALVGMEFLMQPIRRTAVIEEVDDNELPMEPLHFHAVAIGADELPPMATASADGQICAADGGAAAEVDAEPQASEQSIGQIDPKTPGWTRRDGGAFHRFSYKRACDSHGGPPRTSR